MKIKFITLMSLCIATCMSSFAQVRLDPYYPYSKNTVGFGMGFSEIYGNLNHSNSEPVFRLNYERNLGPWFSLDAQLQHGALSDYETRNHWTNGLSVYNQITTLDATARMSIGDLFKHPHNFGQKTLFGLYIGTGAGIMRNQVSNITQKFKAKDKVYITDVNKSSIKTITNNFYIPFVLGFNLHITKRCMFNMNYQFNYAFSDYLDGYNFAKPTANNNYNDMYSVFSFGLNFYLGQVGVEKKDTNKK